MGGIIVEHPVLSEWGNIIYTSLLVAILVAGVIGAIYDIFFKEHVYWDEWFALGVPRGNRGPCKYCGGIKENNKCDYCGAN